MHQIIITLVYTMITMFYGGAKGGVTYQNAEFYEISHQKLWCFAP